MTNQPSAHTQHQSSLTSLPRSSRGRRAVAIVAAGLLASSLIAESAQARGGFGGGGFGGGGFGGTRGGMMNGGGMRSTGGMQRATGNMRTIGTKRLPATKMTGTKRYPGKISRYPKGDGKVASRDPKYPKYPRHPTRWPTYPGGVITTIPTTPLLPVTTLPPNGSPPTFIGPNQPPNSSPPGQGALAQGGGFNVPPPGETRFVPDQVLLSIPATISVPALDAIALRNQLTRLDVRDFTMTGRRIALMRINDGRPVPTVIAALQAEAGIISGAQANFLFALEQAATAAARSPDQYAYTKMNLPQAHALARGNAVRVAVIDTPIDAKHPDLAGTIAASYDATSADDRPHSHGTAIAGIIAAHGKLTGAAPSVQILAIASFSAQAANASSMNILKGLDWAGTSSADVVNMSFAGPADAEIRTMLGALRRKGIVLVAAAGNKGPSSPPLYPAAEPDVIAVTATDSEDNLFDQANRGAHIAVAAPGVSILVAAPNGSYGMQSGTSMASAQVSGIAALLIERNRNLDPAAIREILTSTAHDLGPVGHDDQFGAGLVDALAALESGSAKASEVSAAATR